MGIKIVLSSVFVILNIIMGIADKTRFVQTGFVCSILLVYWTAYEVGVQAEKRRQAK